MTTDVARAPLQGLMGPGDTVPLVACSRLARPSTCGSGMTLCQVMRELQIVLALILGACPLGCQCRLAAVRPHTDLTSPTVRMSR